MFQLKFLYCQNRDADKGITVQATRKESNGGRGGKGEEGVGWGEGTRESNQYRKVGDREAMRREATDPTYSFADMIIGTLSQLKLILDQNESKGQTETRKELSCGGRERKERGERFQS